MSQNTDLCFAWLVEDLSEKAAMRRQLILHNLLVCSAIIVGYYVAKPTRPHRAAAKAIT